MSDTRVRSAVIAAGAVALTFLITHVVLSGIPTAIVFSGAILGLINGLLAVGIVLIYRSHRIINFAQAAMGAAGAIFAYNLVVFLEWPYMLAFVASVIVSVIVAIAIELGFVRRFFDAPRLVLTVITIAVIPGIGFLTGQLDQLPLFGSSEDRTVEELAGREIVTPFADWTFRVGAFPLDFRFGHLFAIVVGIAALLGLAAFFRFSRTGIALRAAAENAERARLLGISVGNLSLVSWAIAGVLGGLAVTLFATVQEQFGTQPAPPELLLVALAAATFARMRSMPAAAGSAVLITIVRQAVEFKYEEQAGLVFIGLFFLLVVSLIVAGAGSKRRGRRSEESEASSWRATEEARSTPQEMLQIAGIRLARRLLVVLGVAAVLIFPWVVSSGQANLAGYYALIAIALLSLTVLTGWAGQVSLGQFGFVAIGAVLGGALTGRLGLSFWLALIIVPFLTAGITLLVGIPALRIPGLFLAIATYAMAFAIRAGLFEERYFGWLLPERVERPQLFLLDFEDERSMYYLCVLALVLSVLFVTSLRRTRTGRVLIGLRDNDNNVRAFGIDPVRMKLAAFAVSGFLCGFAGVILAHHQRAVQGDTFPASVSLDIFLFAVVGGVGSTLGVLLGGLFYAARTLLTNQFAGWVLGPVGVLAILYAFPGGLASIALGLRDTVLRIIAQRRQMVVPALFADFDPEALERRLIPLSEPTPQAGLGALPVSRRYRAASTLYSQRKQAASRSADGESAAIGAAAEVARSAEAAVTSGALDRGAES
ncbi:MAG TPA: hypothetical protein VM840_10825 [Actinomycetota bacterium]|nr:hypothetical protein [Actinomycetota bacterium]